MSAVECANCAALLTDQAVICHACTGRLVADLAATPAVLDSLDITLTRQDVITKGAGNGEKPLPFHAKASAVAGQIRAVLYGWAKVLLEEGAHDPAAWAKANRAPAAWLGTQTADIRMREWAADLTRELREGLDEADACMDRYEERLYAGACGNNLGDEGECPTMLWAPLDAEHITCPTCLTQWSVDSRRDKLIASAKGKYLDPKRAASLVTLMTRQRLTVKVIYALAAAGHLHADPLTRAFSGELIYRVGDVLAALKYADDNNPATASELVTWLRDVHGIDLGNAGQGRIRQWAIRYPDEITRAGSDSRGRTLYDRPPILAVARRLAERLVGAA